MDDLFDGQKGGLSGELNAGVPDEIEGLALNEGEEDFLDDVLNHRSGLGGADFARCNGLVNHLGIPIFCGDVIGLLPTRFKKIGTVIAHGSIPATRWMGSASGIGKPSHVWEQSSGMGLFFV